MKKTCLTCHALALAGALSGAPVWAATGNNLPADPELVARQQSLLALDLADLMQIEVISVAKKPQKMGHSAAAVFVITAEDIRRSGVRHLPEALRLAPGLEVARINAHAWAVSARGFNRFYATKLLVLVDGRSVYTSDFSGVLWDQQDIPLEEIERIEVVRGPGGTLWGANAVNGVINIITKHASDTQGGLLSAGGGNAEKGFAEFRYGGTLGEDKAIFYRVYTQAADTGALDNPTQPDGWQQRRAGFRLDSGLGEAQWTLLGGAYSLDADETHWESLQPIVMKTQGGHLLGRWEREIAGLGAWAAQAYYDYSDLDHATIKTRSDMLDVELRHRLSVNDRHELHWGLGYRWRASDIPGTTSVHYRPPQRQDDLFSLFAQDEIALQPDLTLTAGAKIEHNDYTGWEFQPNLRLSWTPDEQHSLWAAVSRAVRTPARVDQDIYVELIAPSVNNPFYPVPLIVTGTGQPDTESETVVAYEIGLRSQASQAFSWDATAFYNDYDELSLGKQAMYADFTHRRIVFANAFVNGAKGRSFGVELAATWSARDWWRFQFAYTWLRAHIDLYPGIASTYDDIYENQSPRHQVSLRSILNLPQRWQADAWLRYVSALPSAQMGRVDSYLTLDLRLAWQASDRLELSLTGQNLLQVRHPEFGADLFNPSTGEVPRGIYGQIRWHF